MNVFWYGRKLKIWQSGGPWWCYHKLTDVPHVKFAFLFQQIQVLDVQETIDRPQGKEYDHDLSETEKAIVREMCNVSLMCLIVYSVLQPYHSSIIPLRISTLKIADQMSLHFLHENKTIALVFIFSLFYCKDIHTVMLKTTKISGFGTIVLAHYMQSPGCDQKWSVSSAFQNDLWTFLAIEFKAL